MGHLAELVQRSYSVLTTEGIDAWIEKIPTRDFVWDMTPMGMGRSQGLTAMRRFYVEWTGSYQDWFIEPGQIEEFSDEIVINSVRQGGRLHGSDEFVDLRYGQLGVWEGERLKLAVNYPSYEAARAAAAELAAERLMSS